MSSNVTITLQIKQNSGTISIDGMRKHEKQWLADALIDLFAVDDAEYDDKKGCITLCNEADNIDTDTLKLSLDELCKELEHDTILYS